MDIFGASWGIFVRLYENFGVLWSSCGVFVRLYENSIKTRQLGVLGLLGASLCVSMKIWVSWTSLERLHSVFGASWGVTRGVLGIT